MHENYIARCAVWAAVFWVISVALLGGIWFAAVRGWAMHWLIALGCTFVFAVTIAATLQVRSYMVRLCAVVRATAGLAEPGDGRLRALH